MSSNVHQKCYLGEGVEGQTSDWRGRVPPSPPLESPLSQPLDLKSDTLLFHHHATPDLETEKSLLLLAPGRTHTGKGVTANSDAQTGGWMAAARERHLCVTDVRRMGRSACGAHLHPARRQSIVNIQYIGALTFSRSPLICRRTPPAWNSWRQHQQQQQHSRTVRRPHKCRRRRAVELAATRPPGQPTDRPTDRASERALLVPRRSCLTLAARAGQIARFILSSIVTVHSLTVVQVLRYASCACE